MTEWWQSISSAAQFYWVVAVFATVLQILLLAGAVFGGHEDFSDSTDVGDGESTAGVKIISLRAITAFFVGFGWAGVLGLSGGLSLTRVALLALVSGLVFAGLLILTLKLMLSMRADGTMDFRNAVGISGKVYVTIPAARSGVGQVEILLQGRLITTHAATESAQPLAPLTPIEVSAVEGGNLLLVKPV